MSLVNMMDSLNGFDQAMKAGSITPSRMAGNEKVLTLADMPAPGEPRITFARSKGAHVTAVVVATVGSPVEGEGCFHVGYAVREDQRGKGLAKSLLRDALTDISTNMRRKGLKAVWIEASVDMDNPASLAVARSELGVEPVEKMDESDGKPFWHFLKRIEL